MSSKSIYLLFFLTLLGKIGEAQQLTRVLFVGNSYTYVNDLPLEFHNIALSNGDTVFQNSSAIGGYTFLNHSTYSGTTVAIDQYNWDFVVLQEQSQTPAFPPSQVATDCYPYAKTLDSLVHVNDSCTKTVFFMTWGRKYGDASNCASYPPICTFAGMQQRLKESYLEMGDDNEALVAPAGEAWKSAWYADSTIDLWQSDQSHPSLAGTYLAACVLYETMFQKSCVGIAYNSTLTPTVAAFLRGVAHQTVIDSSAVWNINQFVPSADYTYLSTGLTVDFTNTSSNCVYPFWDFDDGGTSSVLSPSHTFTAPGTYNVKLKASRLCEADSITKTIVVSPSGIANASTLRFTVFPTPFKDQLNVKSDLPFELELSDLMGRIISREFFEAGSHIVATSNLMSGIYFLKMIDEKGFVVYKSPKVP